MLSSLVHGWRSWKSARAVGLLAVAALGIGIGSTTAIYSVVHAVLLKPLAYNNPERYIMLFGAWRPHPDWWTVFSYGDYVDYAAQARTVEAFGCSSTGSFNVSFHGRPIHATGTQVSASLMRSFGIAPIMGRWFEDKGKLTNADQQVVISASLWRRFGSDPNILGKPLTMNGIEYTISGVMPGSAATITTSSILETARLESLLRMSPGKALRTRSSCQLFRHHYEVSPAPMELRSRS